MNKKIKILTMTLGITMLLNSSISALGTIPSESAEKLLKESSVTSIENTKYENFIKNLKDYREYTHEEYNPELEYKCWEFLNDSLVNLFENKELNEFNDLVKILKTNKLITDLDIKIIDNFIVKYKSTLNKLESSQKELKSNQEKITKDFAQYNIDDFQFMTAYVNDEIDKNLYYITLSDYDEAGNLVLTDQHGVLQTTEVELEQENWFDMYVEFDQVLQIPLEGEAEGSIQEIPLYKELTGERLGKYNEFNEKNYERMSIEDDIDSYKMATYELKNSIINQIINLDNNSYVDKKDKNTKWRKYTNTISCFEVDYPEILGKPVYSYNEDGATFYNAGGTDLRAYESKYIHEFNTPEEYFEQCQYSQWSIEEYKLEGFENVYLHTVNTESSTTKEVIIFYNNHVYHIKLAITDYRNCSRNEIKQFEKYFWDMVKSFKIYDGPVG